MEGGVGKGRDGEGSALDVRREEARDLIASDRDRRVREHERRSRARERGQRGCEALLGRAPMARADAQNGALGVRAVERVELQPRSEWVVLVP